VLRARLSDAKFFWDEDRRHTLESRVEKLKGIVFYAKLGTQFDRVERLSALSGELAKAKGFGNIDVELVRRAARISKSDLTTGVVGEFPELQGVMGYYYALNDVREPIIADAIRDHYKPLGPSDFVPRAPTSLLLALADKLDALIAFFAIDERPTGSSDPFALRRAALGAIRILMENKLRINLVDLFDSHRELLGKQLKWNANALIIWNGKQHNVHSLAVLSFIADRLKVALKENGTRHDLIDAVFSLGNEDDLVRLVARVEALQAFLKSDDGANLLAGYKRAANILKAEEKKDGKTFISEVSETLLSEPAEKALFAALAKARAAISAALEKEDFAAAMQQMASLRVAVDAFFEGVKVNADDKQVRENRLSLLASLRATLHQVADFSRIEG
jgi:glycyl-tRNA synthetase beta chain